MKTLSEFTKLSLKKLADKVDRYLCEVFPAVEKDQLDDLNGVGGIQKLCNALVESIDSFLSPEEETKIKQLSPAEYIGKTMYYLCADGIETADIGGITISSDGTIYLTDPLGIFIGDTNDSYLSLAEAQENFAKKYSSLPDFRLCDVRNALHLDSIDFKEKDFKNNTAIYRFDFAGKRIEFEADETKLCFYVMDQERQDAILWNAITNAFREPIFIMEKEFSRIPDCMCLDSGSGLCHYEEDGNIVDICVSGCVDVRYEGNRYLHFSEMPEKLQKMFHDGSAYNDPNIYIEENNWYELSFNDGDETRDVSYLQGYTPEQLKDFCHRFVIRHKI